MTKNKANNHAGSTRWLTGVAIFTAIVIVLQLIGRYIHFGPFSISLVLVPIVTGAILYGSSAGAWLGFAFGATVLIGGDAAPFMAVNPIGTIVTCIAKGILAGLTVAFVYSLLQKRNENFATIVSSFICPVVNTGVFLLGCLAFFMPTLREWAGGKDVGVYMITGLVGINFLIELAVNMILTPIIIRLVKIGRKSR